MENMKNKSVADKWNCNLFDSVTATSILLAVRKISNFEEYTTFLACPLHFNVFKNKLKFHLPPPKFKPRKAPLTFCYYMLSHPAAQISTYCLA